MIVVAVAMNLLRSSKPQISPEQLKEQARIEAKSKKFTKAPSFEAIKEALAEKKVLLLYFFTGSCSNCEAASPHVNAWYDKYSPAGVQIVGVHTPEFNYQRDEANLKETINKLGIKYPVVADNDYKIWRAYENDLWPKFYVIDRDGFIEYSHAGEGAYYQTEANLKFVLNEGVEMKDTSPLIDTDGTLPLAPKTGDTYLGSVRNDNLGSGEPRKAGTQLLTIPKIVDLNALYLSGTWEFSNEYTENRTSKAKIVIKYNAKEVYLVARSTEPNKLTLSQDGKKTEIEISKSDIYKLITNDTEGEHTLEITIAKPDLKAYVLRFR